MRTISTIAVLLTLAALQIVAGPARAQANRTFVSGAGSDANPCTLAAPCRSFAQALTQTNAGGEITVLDPAGYGTVTINKAVSIVNDGVGEAGVTVTSATDAILVNIAASDVVNLRGLTLVGSGIASAGIVLNSSGALNIQNCVVRGFIGQGILVTAGTATLNVSDTIVSNSGIAAVEIAPAVSGILTAAYTRVQATGSGNGFFINGLLAPATINATIANSTASDNQIGLVVQSTLGKSSTQVMVFN